MTLKGALLILVAFALAHIGVRIFMMGGILFGFISGVVVASGLIAGHLGFSDAEENS